MRRTGIGVDAIPAGDRRVIELRVRRILNLQLEL
jgi:hypothetical protein